MPGAIVPVDPDTTKALVDEIKRMLVIMGDLSIKNSSLKKQLEARETGINDGGPAFPIKDYLGMSLRDYFAAVALQGMFADDGYAGLSMKQLADDAYVWAETMLIARGEQ